MTLLFNKLNLQNSYDKVKFFTLLQFFLVTVSFISEGFATRSILNFSFFFQFVLLVVTFNFYYKALNNLFYSFWNISVILFIIYFLSLGRNFLIFDYPFIAFSYFLSLVLLLTSCYIISSPLYYPRFHWWEYDFRFRADIKCFVDIDGHQYKGRLSDLRRGAACLELFHHMPVGHHVLINVEILNQNFSLYAEVRSKREPIIGRSIIYGVKFINTDIEQKQQLKFLGHYWHESKKVKIRNKFGLASK